VQQGRTTQVGERRDPERRAADRCGIGERPFSIAYGGVDSARREVDNRVGGMQPKINLGKIPAQRFQPRRQPVSEKRGGRGQGDLRRPGAVAKLRDDRRDRRKARPSDFVERCALRRKSDAPRRAVEHATAQIGLKLSDLMADRRGRNCELVGGLPEARSPRDGLERTQGAQGGEIGPGHADLNSS
jgi:hypothetical protein